MTEKIMTNTINQMLTFLNEKTIMESIFHPDFHNPFNPHIDYISQLNSKLKKCNPEVFVARQNFEEPNFLSNTEVSFEDIRVNLGISWGYGTYFDGESVELSDKEKQLLIDTQNTLSEFLNATVILQDTIDGDFEDTMMISVLISNIELEDLFKDEELIVEEAMMTYDEICNCSEDIYSCDCNQ